MFHTPADDLWLFPPPLGLNCLTRALVPASPRWMDGCQRDSAPHPRLSASFNVHFACFPSRLFLPPHLVSPVFRLPPLSSCLSWVFFFFLPRCLSSPHHISDFLLVAFFPPRLQSIVCRSNMWQVVRVKKQERGGEKKHTDKSSFP